MRGRLRSGEVFIIGLIVLGVWTLAAVIYALRLWGQKGHPPGAAFLPFVGIGWLLGALVIGSATHARGTAGG